MRQPGGMHRPYPNRERALAQLRRSGAFNRLATRTLAELQEQIFGEQPGRYVISSRRR